MMTTDSNVAADGRNAGEGKAFWRHSIRTKIILMLALALFVFGFASATISYKLYMDASIEQHQRERVPDGG